MDERLLLLVGGFRGAGANELRREDRRHRDELARGVGSIQVDIKRTQADCRCSVEAAYQPDELLDTRLIGVESVGRHSPELYSAQKTVR